MTVDGVHVTQILQIINNATTGHKDTVQISYSAKNMTASAKSIGIRIMLDTMLGQNDGAPFKVPSLGTVTYERELSGNAIPQFWQAFDDLTTPSVFAVGTLYKTGDIKPDKIQFVDWQGIYYSLSSWDYTIDPSQLLTGDSAVAVYWNPKTVAAGETITVNTYYGVGYSDRGPGSGGRGSRISIDANTFVVEVKTKYGNAISNANVTIEGIGNATTDTNGIARFTVHSPAQKKITVSATGFQTTEVIRPVKRGSSTLIVLNPDNGMPYIKSIILEDSICLLSDSIIFQANPYGQLTSKIVITAEPKGVSNLRYRLVQDGLVIAENTTGVFRIVIQKDFKPDAPIYAYVEGPGGIKSAMYLTGIKVVKSPVGSYNSLKLSFGRTNPFYLPEDWPIIGGEKVEFGFSEFPVQVDIDGDTVKIAIGITKHSETNGYFSDDPNSRFWSDLKREYEEVLTKRISDRVDFGRKFGGRPSAFLAGKVKLEVQLLGYGEGRLTSGNTFINVGLYLKIKGESGWTQYFFLGYIPLYASVKVGADFDLLLTISTSLQNDPFKILKFAPVAPFEELKVTVYLNPAFGSGVQGVLSVEVGGKFNFPFIYRFDPLYIEVRSNGTLYARASAFVFSIEAKKQLFNEKIYSDYIGQDIIMFSSDKNMPIEDYSASFNLYDTDSYTLMNRDYLNKTPYSLRSSETDNVVTLRSNVFPQSQPRLISVGDKQYLFWLDDGAFYDIDRSDENRTVLMFSCFDGNSWSDPKAVLEDGTADFYFDVATDGNDVYVAWTNCKDIFKPGVNLEEMIAKAEIAVARINGMSIIETDILTDNDHCDMLPAVAINKFGDVFVAWIEKEDNKLFDGNISSISFSKYTVFDYVYGGPDDHTEQATNDGDSKASKKLNDSFATGAASSASWSSPAKIESFSSKQILSMDCGIIDGDFAVAYALDEDGDYNTSDDRKIYIRKEYDTRSYSVSGDPAIVSNPQFGLLNGKQSLFWFNDGNISYLTESSPLTVKNVFYEAQINLADNFSIIADNQKTYIVWTLGDCDDNGNSFTNVLAIRYDGSSWSNSVKVSEIGANASKLSGVINTYGRPEVAFAYWDQDIYHIQKLEIVSPPDVELIDLE